MSTSECSSGCESGWTAYLDQSSNYTYDVYEKIERSKRVTLQDEDEDSSMVSDASSGPRHDNNHEEKHNCFSNYLYSGSASKQGTIRKHEMKSKENKGKFLEDSNLDDTASSPVLSFSEASLFKHSSPGTEQDKKIY